MKRLPILLLCLYGSLSSLWAQPEVTPVQPGRTPEGAVYFLPKTAIRFHLLIERQTYTPGTFARYADRYMHMQGISTEKQVTHSIANFEVSTVGIRDTAKCFSVVLKGKSKAADIRLSDDGILLAVNAEPVQQATRKPFRPARKSREADPLELLSPDALKAGSIAKVAELTAQQILELQEARQQLVTGEADNMPQDEQQLRLMLSEIDTKANALKSLFTGSIRRDTTEHVLTVCPDQEMEREVVFRLSKQLGLVDADDLAGVPFYLTLKRKDQATLPMPENKKRDGFYTNMPTLAELTLSQEDTPIGNFEVPLAQFGFVELREGSLFKQNNTQMQLHPATGAVITLHTDTDK